MRHQKVFLQVRDIADTPLAADVSVVRRGMQVGAASTSTVVNSPDPGALVDGDICYVIRDGSILTNPTVTLLGDPIYDPDLRYWVTSTSVVGGWTPQEFDRLVLTGLEAEHIVEIYDDPLGESTPVTQPLTLGVNGIFEQWAQHSGYDVKLVDNGDAKYVVGEADELKTFVTPEEFGAIGDGVTNDSHAFQAALDYAHSVGGLYVRCLPKTYRAGDIAIRRGVNVSGAYVYRSQADQRYRGTMIVGPRAGVAHGVIWGLGSDASQETSDRLRGFKFEDITFANAWLEDDWSTPITAPDNRPIVIIEDAARVHFSGCEFTHADRNAIQLRGVWDSWFDHCRFMESGADKIEGGSGYATTVMEDSTSGTGYSCNQIHWNDCVWESNADLAIEVKGANPNEIFFVNAKVESATGDGSIAAFTNAKAMGFTNFQTTTAFDDDTVSAISFNNCHACYGNFLVEHIQGSGNDIDHYLDLVGCSNNSFDVTVYGYDQSVNGQIGDDNNYNNQIRLVSHPAQTTINPITKFPESQVNAFEVDSGEVSVLLRRKDKPTYHWLGRLEDDGSGGAVYKHMANSVVAYRILADGTLLLPRPLSFWGGGTFDPDDMLCRWTKECNGTPIDEQEFTETDLIGMWEPTSIASSGDVGEGRLLIGASQTGGGILRFSGTIIDPDGSVSATLYEDVSITDTTGALPTDTHGVAYPDQTNMYLTDNVFRGVITVTNPSGTAALVWMHPVGLDDMMDVVTASRNIHIDDFQFRACTDDVGTSSDLMAHMMIFDYDAATKKISCTTHVDTLFSTTLNNRHFASVRSVNEDILNERLYMLCFVYHEQSAARTMESSWLSFGCFLKGTYEVE